MTALWLFFNGCGPKPIPFTLAIHEPHAMHLITTNLNNSHLRTSGFQRYNVTNLKVAFARSAVVRSRTRIRINCIIILLSCRAVDFFGSLFQLLLALPGSNLHVVVEPPGGEGASPHRHQSGFDAALCPASDRCMPCVFGGKPMNAYSDHSL